MTIQLSEGETKQLDISLVPLTPEPATLLGRVIDASTGQPIAGVLVEILELASTTTAIDGTYGITDIPPGNYTVRFSHPSYETMEY